MVGEFPVECTEFGGAFYASRGGLLDVDVGVGAGGVGVLVYVEGYGG